MATIRENRKNGKVVSYRFIVCLERDVRGKQVRKYTTWTAPADLTPTKAKRAAERAAAEWEDEIRKEYQEQKEAAANGRAYSLPPEKRRDDFAAFVNDTWLLLQVQNGNCKATTIAFYEYMAKVITAYFGGAVMQEQHLKRELSFSTLHLDLYPIGEDIAAVLAIPRASLTGDGSASCTSSVLNVTGHKDEQVCRHVAETLCIRYGVTVVCTGGVHQDNITPEEIEEIQNAILTLLP